MALAAIEPETWWLTIDGLVDRPARLTLADLAALPTVAITAVHECAGSPLAPTEQLEPPDGFAWQRFSSSWTPIAPGRYRLACRCVDLLEQRQPEAGARNAIHAIEVEVLS